MEWPCCENHTQMNCKLSQHTLNKYFLMIKSEVFSHSFHIDISSIMDCFFSSFVGHILANHRKNNNHKHKENSLSSWKSVTTDEIDVSVDCRYCQAYGMRLNGAMHIEPTPKTLQSNVISSRSTPMFHHIFSNPSQFLIACSRPRNILQKGNEYRNVREFPGLQSNHLWSVDHIPHVILKVCRQDLTVFLEETQTLMASCSCRILLYPLNFVHI